LFTPPLPHSRDTLWGGLWITYQIKSKSKSNQNLELYLICCTSRKLARVSVMWVDRRRPAIERAAALRTDWRRLTRVAEIWNWYFCLIMYISGTKARGTRSYKRTIGLNV